MCEDVPEADLERFVTDTLSRPCGLRKRQPLAAAPSVERRLKGRPRSGQISGAQAERPRRVRRTPTVRTHAPVLRMRPRQAMSLRQPVPPVAPIAVGHGGVEDGRRRA